MILSKLDEGYSFRELAEEYQISPTNIQNWKKRLERKQCKRIPSKIDNDA
ncbi:helix-turn-helix domain-containing protein, partial [Psychrobacter sanguinis]